MGGIENEAMRLDTLVAHHHEIGLKGRNRDRFEDLFALNIKRAVRHTGYARVWRGFGRVVVEFGSDSQPEVAARRASNVFGCAFVGVGVQVQPEMESISRAVLPLLAAEPFGSFRIKARRTYSSSPLRSREIHEEIGARAVAATGGRVDLKNADATAWVELFGKFGVVYRQRIEGPGGLPAGSSTRMLALLSGGIDSPVAAWRMGRRGAAIELVHFHGRPFTDGSSIHQAEELAEVFNRYNIETNLHLIPLGDAQREVATHAPSEMRVILYRRMMVRIAAELARQRDAHALVMGDSLGQVASQTIENMTTVDAAIAGEIPVLRPLVGMTKQEIIDKAKDIGTFEISTRKHQDCCVLFEPRSPIIRSTREMAEKAEAGLDIETLVGKALAGVETRCLELPPAR